MHGHYVCHLDPLQISSANIRMQASANAAGLATDQHFLGEYSRDAVVGGAPNAPAR